MSVHKAQGVSLKRPTKVLANCYEFMIFVLLEQTINQHRKQIKRTGNLWCKVKVKQNHEERNEMRERPDILQQILMVG